MSIAFESVSKSTKAQMKKIVQSHYELAREITDCELVAEIKNLRRKQEKHSLDDFDEALWVSLSNLT